MKFHIVIKKEVNFISIKDYDTKEQAEKKLQKKYSDAKLHAKIVSVPEIKCGLRLYKNGGFYYKTILKSTKSIYYLDNTEKVDFDNSFPDPVNKTKIFDWFIAGMLDDGIEEYDENYVGLDWVEVIEDEELEKLVEDEFAEV